MEKIRKPIFIIALALALVVLLIELGSASMVGLKGAHRPDLDQPPPGLGIPSLALLDGLVFYTCLLIGAAFLIPERIQGRVQGIISLIVSLLVLLAAIAMALKAVALLTLMVTLLLAVPFGTIAYFILYADFDTGAAAVTLSLIMTLKLIFAGCLLFAHQRFLQNKGLVLIVLTSLLSNVVIALLHGLVPGFLVSITDTIAAIIVAILAAIWAIAYLVSSIISIVKSVS
jgi:hypothetical protein